MIKMEKRIEELEESVKVLARYMKSELEKLEALSKVDHRAPLDSKVAMLSKEVAEIRKMVEKTAQYSMKEDQLREVSEQNLEEMLEEVKPLGKKIESELEEETIERISFDKSVSDIKQRLAVLESNVRSLNEKQ